MTKQFAKRDRLAGKFTAELPAFQICVYVRVQVNLAGGVQHQNPERSQWLADRSGLKLRVRVHRELPFDVAPAESLGPDDFSMFNDGNRKARYPFFAHR